MLISILLVVCLTFRPIGSDLRKGERLFKATQHFPDVVPFKSLLASVGINSEPIPQEQATVCILSTGDELTPPGKPLQSGKIYDSNTTMLVTLLKQHGFDAVTTVMVNDTLVQYSVPLHSDAFSIHHDGNTKKSFVLRLFLDLMQCKRR